MLNPLSSVVSAASNSVTVPRTRYWAVTALPICALLLAAMRPLWARSCSPKTSLRSSCSRTTNLPLRFRALISCACIPSPRFHEEETFALFSNFATATIFFRDSGAPGAAGGAAPACTASPPATVTGA